MLDLTKSRRKTAYFGKDARKAAAATKFIGRGSALSSTAAYARACGDLSNCHAYTREDVVMISAEGNRRGRLTPDFTEIDLAIAARSRFITDCREDRERAYNIGEREVARYLAHHGYREYAGGHWMPQTSDIVGVE
ncbi:hypothetical protein HT136_22260 [Novosphingobium profundi]|uniref:hypothetical protein n=1 Tax=Novosphingobium profundi TaxID=1774954 RepID=UPI001BDAE9CF|nr:hypothetical protein [Novosphingobium profundi]MBT0671100.1 hypothetical protein [Novosphingobium profundi]